MVRGEYNDTYFRLQKANELVTSKERERNTAVELVKKKEEELRNQRRQNQTLSAELRKLKIEIGSTKKQKAEKDQEIVNLRRENHVLKARVNQFQFGVAENRNAATAVHRLSRKKESVSKIHDTYEVENLLNDELRNGKRYYLVKWKGYDMKHNTWEQQSNLNCPKVLAKYLNNKRKHVSA